MEPANLPSGPEPDENPLFLPAPNAQAAPTPPLTQAPAAVVRPPSKLRWSALDKATLREPIRSPQEIAEQKMRHILIRMISPYYLLSGEDLTDRFLLAKQSCPHWQDLVRPAIYDLYPLLSEEERNKIAEMKLAYLSQL